SSAPGTATGILTDTSGAIYAAMPDQNTVCLFPASGGDGKFPANQSSYAGPTTIVCDGSGNIFVGQSGGAALGDILKIDPAGNITAYNVQTVGGAPYLDLAADGHTVFYTSGGSTIYTFDLNAPGNAGTD